jgi:hypothetical protein
MLKKRERTAERIEVPEVDQTEIHAHVEELIRRGVARPPIAPLPDDFLTRLPVKMETSILELVLEDRYSDED